MSIDGVVNYNRDYLEPKITQKTIVSITNETNFSLIDAIKNISLFEQFVSFATLKPIESSEIVLFDKSKFQQLKNDKKYYFPIEYIRVYRSENSMQQQDIHQRGDFLFTYETIKSEFGTILKKWYDEQDNIAPIRHHLIECVHKKGIFSSVDFLVVIQSIEGFWWRFRDDGYRQQNNINPKKRTELKTILEKLVLEFKEIERLKLSEINITEVVDSRNYFSHFVYKVNKPSAKDGLELYHLTCQIRKLLICCLLNFVGFYNDQITNIIKESNSSILHD